MLRFRITSHYDNFTLTPTTIRPRRHLFPLPVPNLDPLPKTLEQNARSQIRQKALTGSARTDGAVGRAAQTEGCLVFSG